MSANLVYVGTYSEPILFGTGQVLQGKGEGVHIFRFDAATGALTPAGVARGVAQTRPISPSIQTGAFSTASTSSRSMKGRRAAPSPPSASIARRARWTFLNMKASGGTDPCHLIVDATGRNVLVANFASGGVSVFPIGADGALGDASCFIQHHGSSVDPRRQAGPHAHAVEIDPKNRFVFVPDLGLDQIVIYAFDAARGNADAERPSAVRADEARRRTAPARVPAARPLRLSHQ